MLFKNNVANFILMGPIAYRPQAEAHSTTFKHNKQASKNQAIAISKSCGPLNGGFKCKINIF